MEAYFTHPWFLWGMPGTTEWIIIIMVILLFFGGRKIPELMRGIGKGVREFNDAKTNLKDELDAGMNEKDQKQVKSPVAQEIKTP